MPFLSKQSQITMILFGCMCLTSWADDRARSVPLKRTQANAAPQKQFNFKNIPLCRCDNREWGTWFQITSKQVNGTYFKSATHTFCFEGTKIEGRNHSPSIVCEDTKERCEAALIKYCDIGS